MEFRVLGTLDIVGAAGRTIEVRGAKVRTLLAALVLEVGRPVSADRLSEVLWGDAPPPSATNALQAQVSKLRKNLTVDGRPPPLATTANGYMLDVDPSTIDAHRFAELARRGRELLASGQSAEAADVLRRALGLWRGPALSDFEFDAFADADRIRLNELRCTAQEDAFDAELAEGRHDSIVGDIEHLLVQSPLRERLWGQLMISLYRSGRQADALRAYQRARQHLADELGLDPGADLQALETAILNHDAIVDAPGVGRPRARRSNLTSDLSTFFGRSEELAEIDGVLRDRRLVTLVGPGGAGKTRLATEIALRAETRFVGGAWMLELADVRGPGAVLAAFARTFGSAVSAPVIDDASGALVEALRAEEMLIVLDNCEHVIVEAAHVASMVLRACPGITMLATSREALTVPGEVVRVMRPLAPADAAAMFADRAHDAADHLEISASAEAAIAVICERLDHLPLALELAAARTRAFTVEQLAELLNDRLQVLNSTSGARPTRQQTLEAMVDWSYTLLFEAEQLLLARLSAFRGGFTMDAAVAVCGDDALPHADVGLLLARLVDKSLVIRTRAGRFGLLTAVAEFAAAKLAGIGETASVRDRHLDWLVTMTEPLTRDLRGPEPLSSTGMLAGEELNLHEAAHWAVEGGDISKGIRLGCQISWFGFLSANFEQDAPLLLHLLASADHIEPSLRCQALMWTGLLSIGRDGRASRNVDSLDAARGLAAFSHADTIIRLPDGGTSLSLGAVELARSLADERLLLDAVVLAAFRLAASGTRRDVADALLFEGRELADRLHDEWSRLLVVVAEGLLAFGDGDLDASATTLAAARDGFSAIGDVGTSALVDISCGEVAIMCGDITAARRSFERAAALGTAAGFRSAMVLRVRSVWLATVDGDVAMALRLGHELLDDARTLYDPVNGAHAMFSLGSAEALAGNPAAAERLTVALGVYDRFGIAREASFARTELGYIATRSARTHVATAEHRLALATALRTNALIFVAPAAIGLASALLDDGDEIVAGRLLGYVAAAIATSKYVPSARDPARWHGTRQRVADRLSDHATAEMAHGAQWTMSDLRTVAVAVT